MGYLTKVDEQGEPVEVETTGTAVAVQLVDANGSVVAHQPLAPARVRDNPGVVASEYEAVEAEPVVEKPAASSRVTGAGRPSSASAPRGSQPPKP